MIVLTLIGLGIFDMFRLGGGGGGASCIFIVSGPITMKSFTGIDLQSNKREKYNLFRY